MHVCVEVTEEIVSCLENNNVSITVVCCILNEMVRPSVTMTQGPSTGNEELWLDDGCPGGATESRDWLAAGKEAEPFQLPLSRLAKSWRCCVQVKGTSDTNPKTFALAESGECDGNRLSGETHVCLRIEKLSFWTHWKSSTLSVLEESPVVSTNAWLPGTHCTTRNLDSCVFSSKPSTKNETIETRWAAPSSCF